VCLTRIIWILTPLHQVFMGSETHMSTFNIFLWFHPMCTNGFFKRLSSMWNLQKIVIRLESVFGEESLSYVRNLNNLLNWKWTEISNMGSWTMHDLTCHSTGYYFPIISGYSFPLISFADFYLCINARTTVTVTVTYTSPRYPYEEYLCTGIF
jgi:hypothetical protein